MGKDQTLKMIQAFQEWTNNILAATSPLIQLRQRSGDERELKYLAIVQHNLYCMMRMISHWEFILNKNAVYQPSLVDGAELCQNLGREVESLIHAFRKELTFTCSQSEENVFMTADESLLKLALLNLISNAVEHSGEGGKISLSLSCQKDYIHFTVWNNGNGLQTPTKQEDMPYLKELGGVGLGMKTVQKIAKLHGGAVLEKKSKKGVSVILSIPLKLSESPLAVYAPRYDLKGGFSYTLVELSTVLPSEAFLPEEWE